MSSCKLATVVVPDDFTPTSLGDDSLPPLTCVVTSVVINVFAVAAIVVAVVVVVVVVVSAAIGVVVIAFGVVVVAIGIVVWSPVARGLVDKMLVVVESMVSNGIGGDNGVGNVTGIPLHRAKTYTT